MSKILALTFTAILLSACGSPYYEGNSYYYHVNDARWECREPAPWQGGNCKPIDEWEDKSLSQ